MRRYTWPYKCKQDLLALIPAKLHPEAIALMRLLEEMAEGRGKTEASMEKLRRKPAPVSGPAEEKE